MSFDARARAFSGFGYPAPLFTFEGWWPLEVASGDTGARRRRAYYGPPSKRQAYPSVPAVAEKQAPIFDVAPAAATQDDAPAVEAAAPTPIRLASMLPQAPDSNAYPVEMQRLDAALAQVSASIKEAEFAQEQRRSRAEQEKKIARNNRAAMAASFILLN